MDEREILKSFNAPAGAILVSTFKNGNIKIKRKVICSRCVNEGGIFYTGVLNGHLVPSHVNNGVCFKCNGAGWNWSTEILMTAENKAKHDMEIQKRAEKAAEEEARREAERIAEEQRKEAEKKAEEERIKAEKAISQYVGNAGEKFEASVTFLFSAHFEVPSFSGFGTELMFVHKFADAEGNKLIWKTSKGLPEGIENGDAVVLKGTIKGHNEYKDEKQTVLTRCKVSKGV